MKKIWYKKRYYLLESLSIPESLDTSLIKTKQKTRIFKENKDFI